MKKILTLLVCILLITGCGSTKDNKKEGFEFATIEYSYLPGEEYDESIHGKASSSFESENCALGNKNIVYIYDGYQVEVFEKDGKYYIYSIYIDDENTETPEGLKKYDSIKSMMLSYGEDYEKKDDVYTYTKGDTSLVVVISNDMVTSIEYKYNNAY